MVSEYKNGHPNELVVKKDRFPQLLKILMERTQASSTVNLQNGFIKCLSHESVFAQSKFKLDKRKVNSVVNQALLDILQTKRFGSSLRKASKRKKLDVVPGRNVEDLDGEDESDNKNDNGFQDMEEPEPNNLEPDQEL